jgi:hypothetical protein
MPILSKGQTFADGDQVTSTKLNNLVDAATFVSGSSGTTDNATLQVNGSGRLEVKTIQTGNIANGAVTTVKIPDSNITTAKIADANVTEVKIADANVTAVKIGASAVITDKIAAGAVTAPKLSGAQTGTAPIFGVRAWGKFEGQSSDGLCVLNAGGNVASVTRISSGLYEIVMTNAMPSDTSYAVVATSDSFSSQMETGFTETNTTFRLRFRNSSNANTNPTEASFIVIR